MNETIKVKGDEPTIKNVVLPSGATGIADIINAFQVNGNNYLTCWFPLDSEEIQPFRFEEINGFIRLYEIENKAEFKLVRDRLSKDNK